MFRHSPSTRYIVDVLLHTHLPLPPSPSSPSSSPPPYYRMFRHSPSTRYIVDVLLHTHLPLPPSPSSPSPHPPLLTIESSDTRLQNAMLWMYSDAVYHYAPGIFGCLYRISSSDPRSSNVLEVRTIA